MSARPDIEGAIKRARVGVHRPGDQRVLMAEIDRLQEQVRSFANEIVQMHHDRDVYDTALEAQLTEARYGLDERDRIICERDNEIAALRVGGVAERAVLDAAEAWVKAKRFDVYNSWDAALAGAVGDMVHGRRGAAPTPGGRLGFGVDNETELQPQPNPKETP